MSTEQATMVTVELWQGLVFLFGLIVTFVSAVWALGKLMIRQFNINLDNRFAEQEKLRQEARTVYAQKFDRLEQANVDREREVLQLRAELPMHYVRREDVVRMETVTTAKLDSIGSKMELVLERVARIEGAK